MASYYTRGPVTTPYMIWEVSWDGFEHFCLGSHNFMVTALGGCPKWPLHQCRMTSSNAKMESEKWHTEDRTLSFKKTIRIFLNGLAFTNSYANFTPIFHCHPCSRSSYFFIVNRCLIKQSLSKLRHSPNKLKDFPYRWACLGPRFFMESNQFTCVCAYFMALDSRPLKTPSLSIMVWA